MHGLVKGMYDGYVLGHETMGIVVDAGKEVRNLKKATGLLSVSRHAHCEFREF